MSNESLQITFYQAYHVTVCTMTMWTVVCLTGTVLAFLALFLLYRRYRLLEIPHKQVGFLERMKYGPIAHRAGTPENTLAGLRKAKEEGASAIEVDLEFSRDGHPVLLHDSTVDGTSNGSGQVGDFTLEELKNLDFGFKFGYVCLLYSQILHVNA